MRYFGTRSQIPPHCRKKRANFSLLLSIFSLVFFVSSCSAPRPAANQRPNCDPAIKCPQLVRPTDAKCEFDERERRTLYSVKNNHPTKDVRVTYREEVRHLNTNLPNEVIRKTVAVGSKKTEPLGCARTSGLGPGAIDDWSYSFADACFLGEECDPIGKPLGEVPEDQLRPAALSCEESCENDDQYCVKQHLRRIDGSVDINRSISHLSSNPAPTRGTIAPLINLLFAGAAERCSRYSYTIKYEEFRNAGDSCAAWFDLSGIGNGQYKYGVVNIPGSVAALHQPANSAEGFVLDFSKSPAPTVPYASIYQVNAPKPWFDRLNKISAIKTSEITGEVLFSTSNSFCVAISYEVDG